MKRFLTTSFALLTMVLAPLASFGRDWGSGHDEQDDQSSYAVQDRYDRSGNKYYNQRNAYGTPRDNYNYERNGYGYSNRDRWGRSAAYVGGGAAAGAAIGAIIGHGKGAAIGALAGSAGGYLYKKHNDRRYNDRRY